MIYSRGRTPPRLRRARPVKVAATQYARANTTSAVVARAGEGARPAGRCPTVVAGADDAARRDLQPLQQLLGRRVLLGFGSHRRDRRIRSAPRPRKYSCNDPRSLDLLRVGLAERARSLQQPVLDLAEHRGRFGGEALERQRLPLARRLIAARHRHHAGVEVARADLDADGHAALDVVPVLLAAAQVTVVDLDAQRFIGIARIRQLALQRVAQRPGPRCAARRPCRSAGSPPAAAPSAAATPPRRRRHGS